MAFIDALNNPITREIQKDYNRAIAQKIRNRLQQLENANEKDKKRWIWELLQNANDTVTKNETVDIEIIVGNNLVEFRHNGGYFSPRNITNLVHQISSKEGQDNIGRFGTGFLTTHTLSRIVEVSGIYTEENTYYSFKIHLDRTGHTEPELVKCIEKTWETFDNELLTKKPLERVWTSFKYLKPNINIAKNTITNMDYLRPLVA
ncbi:MAG: ATP-binding protein [Saprospiraceae bacterium]